MPRAVSTSPGAGLPLATLPFPAEISRWGYSSSMATPSQLNTPHYTPPQAPCSEKSITAKHKAKHPMGKELLGSTRQPTELPIVPPHSSASEVGTSNQGRESYS